MNILRKLPDLLLPSSLRELFQTTTDLLRLVLAGLRRIQEPRGLYEVLGHQVTMDLLDSAGARAIYRKHKRLRLTQDNVSTIYDHAWGEGNQVARYQVTPGRVGPRFAAGSRMVTPIVLTGPRPKGEVVHLRVQRLVENGFLKPEEWLEAQVTQPTKRLRLQVIFPKDRPCKQAQVSEQAAGRLRVLGRQHLRYLSTGRQQLSYEVREPQLKETYALQWKW